MTGDPLISVCCTTYNHRNYIKDAIEGFIMQKTDFPIEVIIHDDASTDGTAEIIEHYAQKYPNLIFPIFQIENQHSKMQGHISARFVWPRAHGKYIALCEGDDYWTDPYKLQKQLDIMITYPECNICFHPALIFDSTRLSEKRILADYGNSPRLFNVSEVIFGGGGFMPTVSVMINSRVIKNIPDWYTKAPIGDYYLQILGSLHGGALYLNDVMAVYRANLKGSWSDKIKNGNFRLNFSLKHLETLDLANNYIKSYPNEFEAVKRNVIQSVLEDQSIGRHSREALYHQQCQNMSFKNRLLWILIYRNTPVHKFLAKGKKLLNYLHSLLVSE